MNAKRLTMALLVSLLISGLFTFWLSRRVARAAHVAAAAEANVVAAKETLEAGELLKPEKHAFDGVAGFAPRAALSKIDRGCGPRWCCFRWPRTSRF